MVGSIPEAAVSSKFTKSCKPLLANRLSQKVSRKKLFAKASRKPPLAKCLHYLANKFPVEIKLNRRLIRQVWGVANQEILNECALGEDN